MTDTLAPAPARTDRLRPVLILLAALEVLCCYSSATDLFDADLARIMSGGWDGVMVMLDIVRPVLAVAALIFALRRNPRLAIVALAGITLLVALGSLPSTLQHGLQQGADGLRGLHFAAKVTLFPLLALGAVALAARNARLGLATVMVSVPMIVAIVSAVAFFFGVAVWF